MKQLPTPPALSSTLTLCAKKYETQIAESLGPPNKWNK